MDISLDTDNINTLLTNMEKDVDQHLYSVVDEEDDKNDKNIFPLLNYDSYNKLKNIRKKANTKKYRSNILFKKESSTLKNCRRNISDSLYSGFISDSDKSTGCHSDCDDNTKRFNTASELREILSELSNNKSIKPSESSVTIITDMNTDTDEDTSNSSNNSNNSNNSNDSIGNMDIIKTDEKGITNTERKKINSMFESVNNK